MQTKTVTPAKPVTAKPQELIAKPAPIREREVKRFIAFCPFEESGFNVRAPKTLHSTKDAATVEAIRHARASHGDSFFAEVKAVRRAQVVRTIVGEEIVEG